MSVVDASLLVRVLTATPQDQHLRDRLAEPTDQLHAPDHIEIEVISAISGLLKGSRIDRGRAALMLGQFADLAITRHSDLLLHSRIIDLRRNFTAYDAAYVALAETLDQVLLTTDGKFERAPREVHSAQIKTY